MKKSDLQKNCQFLLDYTKEEIIDYVSTNWRIYYNICERDFLFGLWENRSKALQERRSKLCDEGNYLVELAKERDEYAMSFNASTSNDERMNLMKKMSKFNEAYKVNKKKWDVLEKEQEAVDVLYEKASSLKESK
jgi:hypothetical protein